MPRTSSIAVWISALKTSARCLRSEFIQGPRLNERFYPRYGLRQRKAALVPNRTRVTRSTWVAAGGFLGACVECPSLVEAYAQAPYPPGQRHDTASRGAAFGD